MFVVVNLKTYRCDPVEIATAARSVSEDSDTRIGVAPQIGQLQAVAQTGVETWAQHVDPIEHGSNTGHVLAESVAEAGGTGTILNHSERRLKLASLDGSLGAAGRAGLETIVCANNPTQIRAAAALGPDAVAVEPPELIGTGTPVSQADPGIVEDAVEAATEVDDRISVLCGAGISTSEDVIAARELGADGVLLASGVVKASDPEQALNELVKDI